MLGLSPGSAAGSETTTTSPSDAHVVGPDAQDHSSSAPGTAAITTSPASSAEDPISDMFTRLASSLQACITAYRKRPKDEVATDYVHDSYSELYKTNLCKNNQVSDLLNAMCQDVHKFTSSELYAAFNVEGIASNFGKLAGKVQTWERHSPKELDLMARAMHLRDIPVPDFTMMDTDEKVQEMIMVICAADVSAGDEPNLTLDFEGLNLGHDGTSSLMQAQVRSIDHVFLLVVTTLDRAAFDTSVFIGEVMVSMGTIIEDASRKKLLWDCRSDSEALEALYNISLAGAIDVQLMDVITRRCLKKERSTVRSLAMSLPTRLNKTLSDATLARWSTAKYWVGQAMGGRLAEAEAEYKIFGGDSKAAKKAANQMTPEEEAEHTLAKEAAKAATARTLLRVNGCPTCRYKEDSASQVDNSHYTLGSESSEHSSIPQTGESDSDASAEFPDLTITQASQPSAAAPPTYVNAADVGDTHCEDPSAVRPLPQILLKYAIGDVYLLYILYKHFLEHERWNEHAAAAVITETQRRLDLSQAEGGYKANAGVVGGGNAAPKGWDETIFKATGPVPKGEQHCD
ncbi:hypothetical protein B0A48_08012 [Cryoendolithus antarcticus]|uniref:3'-5' exonuclease domain-containing protein n=1 Tax=Cryoendolithus antarcticus TaxID=1507870 RepID=A0A1V8T0P7_9PEZI|nr:hypothetical protein B0A48_08012 [Cryoendolithus antarcticus]